MAMKRGPLLDPFGRVHVLATGVMLVYFWGMLISLVDESGRVVWLHPDYSVALVEYLIECPSPNAYKWN